MCECGSAAIRWKSRERAGRSIIELIEGSYGQDQSDRQNEEASGKIEIQSASLQSLQLVRASAWLHASLRHLPHLFSWHEPSWFSARRDKELVVMRVEDIEGIQECRQIRSRIF